MMKIIPAFFKRQVCCLILLFELTLQFFGG